MYLCWFSYAKSYFWLIKSSNSATIFSLFSDYHCLSCDLSVTASLSRPSAIWNQSAFVSLIIWLDFSSYLSVPDYKYIFSKVLCIYMCKTNYDEKYWVQLEEWGNNLGRVSQKHREASWRKCFYDLLRFMMLLRNAAITYRLLQFIDQ